MITGAAQTNLRRSAFVFGNLVVIARFGSGEGGSPLTDLIFVAESPTEITLNVAAPASAANAVSAAERRVVRILVTRARA